MYRTYYFCLSRDSSKNTYFRAGNYTGENNYKVSRVNPENVKNELHALRNR